LKRGELMFDKTYTIRGMHATYWKRLSKNLSEKLGPNENGDYKIFERYIDAYMVAPLLGCLYNRKGSKTLPESDDTAGMQANILIKYQSFLTTIYRTVILTNSSNDYTVEEKIDRAFKGDTDENILKENMELFNSYFLGGIEILYETFILECTTNEDYVDKIFEYVNRFYKQMNIDDENEEISI